MAPDALSQVLRQLPVVHDPNLLVGPKHSDDAAVYQLSEDLAIIQTVDFFTPVVDDPYLFGQVAAANSLSDIYAMGGKPLLALNVVCFPSCLPMEILEQILKGGADKTIEAGAIVAGGHTVQDDVPKYGLAVSGLVHPKKILTNAGALPGDLLLLTKPLGTGIINTAAKGDLAPEDSLRAALDTMLELNKKAAEVMTQSGATACTDITGFGLIGHAAEMALASGVSLEIWADSIPLLPGVKSLAGMGMIPAGAYANRDYLLKKVSIPDSLGPEMTAILFDPQTSGGLFIAIPESEINSIQKGMKESGVKAVVVGRVKEKQPAVIEIIEKGNWRV